MCLSSITTSVLYGSREIFPIPRAAVAGFALFCYLFVAEFSYFVRCGGGVKEEGGVSGEDEQQGRASTSATLAVMTGVVVVVDDELT